MSGLNLRWAVNSQKRHDPLTLGQKLYGKYHAASMLVMFLRYFSNWPEVWEAHRGSLELPALRLRGGLTVGHRRTDDLYFLFPEIFVNRVYTRGGFYRPKPKHTVVDVGANIGLFMLYLQWRAPGIKVHCFEPADDTRTRLESNVKANGLGGNVRIYPYAVSDRNGIGWLRAEENPGHCALEIGEGGHPANSKVRTVSLEKALELCGGEHIDLLKVDIEGGEIEVMQGSPPELWKRIDRVAIEFHDNLRPKCREVMTAELAKRGFSSIRSFPLYSGGDVGIIQACR